MPVVPVLLLLRRTEGPAFTAVIAAAIAAVSLPALAAPLGATVPYNEAVRIERGRRVVELPPVVPGYPQRRRPPVIGPFHKAQFQIEHTSGLVQCTYPMFDAASCEPSSYGTVISYRTWIVKRGTQWFGCTGVRSPTRCEPLGGTSGVSGGRSGVLPGEDDLTVHIQR